MKEQTGSIYMSGEKMEVLLEAGCVTSCPPAVATKLPEIMSALCKSLCIRAVARYFIRDVRLGEIIALVDRKNGYTYRLRMDVHAIRVLEIYDNTHTLERNAHAVYLVDWGLLRSIPCNKAVAA